MENKFTLYNGDCLEVMRGMEDNSVDSIVTDPPYGLSFMGKAWDHGVPSVAIWREALRVLKPGGHLLSFGGSRTYHRMASAIEDAGFEIRDQIMWVYGSGFPKSLDVSKAIDKVAGAARTKVPATGSLHKNTNLNDDGWSKIGDREPLMDSNVPVTDSAKQWDGWGTSLKPAHEPIVVARKPLVGTVVANVLTHGTGALNIDGCRIEGQDVPAGRSRHGGGLMEGSSFQMPDSVSSMPAGRWPANWLHDGSDEVLGAFPDAGSAARFFKECKWQDRNPPLSSAVAAEPNSSLQKQLVSSVQNAVAIWPSLAGILSNDSTEVSTPVTQNESKAIDETAMQAMSNIASGFSHESQHERRTPCGSHVRTAVARGQTGTTKITTDLLRSDGSVARVTFSITQSNLDRGAQGSRFNYCAKASKKDRGEANTHPTIKPTDLMAYLCRLVTPPGGVVLDPFMGSGSTGKAALREGFSFIGIEREEEYFNIANSRIENKSKTHIMEFEDDTHHEQN